MEAALEIPHLSEFEKLFKVHIPIKEEVAYYLNLLTQSKEFEDLPVKLKIWQDFCNKTSDPVKEKFQATDLLVKTIKESTAYAVLQSAPVPIGLFTIDKIKDTLKIAPDSLFVSLDIAQANYTALKQFDKDNKEFPRHWDTFCETNYLDPALTISKSFRQVVFGNTNPKRLQMIQHQITFDLFNALKKVGYEDRVIFMSHDELVLTLDEFHALNFAGILSTLPASQFSPKIYKLTKIGKDIFVKTLYKNVNGVLEEKHKTLVGVPGNQFYMYFKQHILEQSIEERDLFFWNDHKLAKWVV